MKLKNIIIMVGILFGTTGVTAQDSVVVSNNNRFAFELFAKMSNNSRNIVLSPFSISMAMSMCYAGARTETETQMQTVMHFGKNPDFHQQYGKVLETIGSLNEQDGLEIKMSNSVWAQKNYHFNKEYFDLLREEYRTDLRFADFATKTEKSRLNINEWVERETNNKIIELLKPGSIDGGTKLVLTNAVYFYGSWAKKFDTALTRKGIFKVKKGEDCEVDFMKMVDKFLYYEEEMIQAVELPYAGNKVSMIIIVPRKEEPIDDLTGLLTIEKYDEILFGSTEQKIDLSLPRFKITSDFELHKVLPEMGMSLAFSSGADFSGMTGGKDLHIDKIIHKAFIEVNEEGTEAGAATAVVMRKSAMIPIKVEADRPFVYIIRDNTSGSILFIGKVNNPSGI